MHITLTLPVYDTG